MKRFGCNWALSLTGMVCLWVLAGCSGGKVQAVDALAAAAAPAGWSASDPVQAFDRKTLYSLVDGQADGFLAYGFQQAATRAYKGAGGGSLRAEVWQLATPADAYGLFTNSRAGAPVEMGNGGDSDPGRRLSFWQDRYYVSVAALEPVSDADVRALAGAISKALPSGGETPQLVSRLPAAGLIVDSAVFFHEEISIQDRVWLGGTNLLELSAKTEGVLAKYRVGGGTVALMLIRYPDAAGASAARAALQGGSVTGLVWADSRGPLLGAVFGEASQAEAEALLTGALSQQ